MLGAGDYAAAVLYNGLGRYADALAAARRSQRAPGGAGVPHLGARSS